MSDYRIILNEPTEDVSPYIYKFGNTNHISVKIGKNKCDVNFTVGKKYELSAFLDPKSYLFRIFRDVLRRTYLLHAFRYDAGLHLDRIIFYADDQEITHTHEDDARFPFIYSMIDEKAMELSEAWKNDNFVKAAVSMTKSQADEDLRFAALASFLASYQKQYLIDTFSALWTSMNAYYNYIAKNFDVWYAKKQADSEKAGDKLYTNDAKSIGAVMSLYQNNVKKFPRKEIGEHFREYLALLDLLRTITDSDLPELYRELEKSRQDAAYQLSEKYITINKNAQALQYSAFNYMMFEIPYYWRCKYFHGSQATTLFMAYTDPECSLLTVINYLLKMYLREEIPQMFDSTYFDGKFELISANIQSLESKKQKKKNKKTKKQQ